MFAPPGLQARHSPTASSGGHHETVRNRLSEDRALNTNLAVDTNDDAIVSPDRVETERCPGQDDLLREQHAVILGQMLAKPSKRSMHAPAHWPELPRSDQAIVDPDTQLAWPLDIISRQEPVLARQDDAAVESIVGDKFRQSFSRTAKDEMVQLDHREGCGDRAPGPEPYGHFSFDRKIREFVPCHRAAVLMDLAFEQASSDRPFHAKLLHSSNPCTTYFVADKAIAGGDTECHHGILQVVRVAQIEDKTWIRKACSGLARSIVTPLTFRQCPDFACHGVTHGGMRHPLNPLATRSQNQRILPSAVAGN